MEFLDRTELLIGKDGAEKLKSKRVAVFGVGGVGGFAVEGLVRSGIKKIAVIDADTVEESNINRQIIATEKTVGKDKTEVIKERILSIDSLIEVETYKVFYSKENADGFDLKKYDYIVDAIDSVPSKVELIRRANEEGVPVISCMGTGKKTDISAIKVADISETKVCPLARVVRHELKKYNIEHLKTVYSTEIPKGEKTENKVIPSMVFVPAVAGLYMAREVVFDLLKGEL